MKKISLHLLFLTLVLVVGLVVACQKFPENPVKAPVPPPRPETLLQESFVVPPGDIKYYSWDLNRGGQMEVELKADTEVVLGVVDEVNFLKMKAGDPFESFAFRDKVTATKFIARVPHEGKCIVFVSNRHSLLSSKHVSLSVIFTPQ